MRPPPALALAALCLLALPAAAAAAYFGSVSAEPPARAPALLPALPPAAAGPAFPSLWPRPGRHLELRPRSGRAHPHLPVGARATNCVSSYLGSDPPSHLLESDSWVPLAGALPTFPVRDLAPGPRVCTLLGPWSRPPRRALAQPVQVSLGAPMPALILTRRPGSPSWARSSRRLCLGLPLHPPPLPRGAETQRRGGGAGWAVAAAGEGTARVPEERRKPRTGRSVRCRPGRELSAGEIRPKLRPGVGWVLRRRTESLGRDWEWWERTFQGN